MLLSIAGPLTFASLIIFASLAMLSGRRFRLGFENSKPYPGQGNQEPKPKPKGKGKDSRILSMALVKYAGNGAMAISGKIGGTVFTIGGQQGPFVRNWAKPRNRRTAAQNLVRGILAGISTSWRTLTTAQADAWNSAGSSAGVSGYNLRKNVFGDSRKLSGSQLYQRINNILLSVGLTAIASPPSTGATDAILSLATTADVSSTQFDVTVTTFNAAVAVPANTYLKIYATAQKGANQSYFSESDYRLLLVVAPASSINPASIYAAYTALFGTLVAGSKIGLKCEFIYYNAGVFSKGGAVNTTAIVVP